MFNKFKCFNHTSPTIKAMHGFGLNGLKHMEAFIRSINRSNEIKNKEEKNANT